MIAALTRGGGSLIFPRDAVALDVLTAQVLARQSVGVACHGVYPKKIGPARKDVATKYLANPGAGDKLYRHFTIGRKAKLADRQEEIHPVVKTADPDRISNLVHRILSLR
jgi:cytochrome c551/c552